MLYKYVFLFLGPKISSACGSQDMHNKVKSSGSSEIADAIGSTKKVTLIPATRERCSAELSKKCVLFSKSMSRLP